MVANHKVTGKASSMPAGLAVGGLVSTLITLLGSVLAANLVLRQVIPQSNIGYCSMVILLLASALGTLTAVNRIKHRKLYVCSLSAMIYYGILLAVTTLFFGGQYQGMGVTALMVICGSGLIALLGMKQKKQKYSHRSKMKRR